MQHWSEAVFFGMLGHRRGERHAGKFGGQCTSESSSSWQSCPATPREANPEGLSVFARVSLHGGKREEGEARSRMPRGCNSSVGRRMVRDRGVQAAGSTSAIHEMASPELLLPQLALPALEPFAPSATSRAGRIWQFWRVMASLQARCIPRQKHSSPRRGGKEEFPLEGLPSSLCSQSCLGL